MPVQRIPYLPALVLAFSAAAAQAEIGLPKELDAPGQRVVMTLRGVGAQIYECRAGQDGALAWQFREPVATLLDEGRTVGRHYAGPTWELAAGGSVGGKVVGRMNGASPADIPWLKLEATAHGGGGPLAGVGTIQRLRTEGGAASGPCASAGAVMAVPYACDYVFLAGR